MKFYKLIDKDHNCIKNFNLDIVQCFVIDNNLKIVHLYYGAKDHIELLITNELTEKLKEIGVL